MALTFVKCNRCDGRGFFLFPVELGKMLSQKVEDCEECKGIGKICTPPRYGADGSWIHPSS